MKKNIISLLLMVLTLLIAFNIKNVEAQSQSDASSAANSQSTSAEISDEQAHYIVLHGTPEEVKELLNKGIDANKMYNCSTLLVTAIKSAAAGSQMAKSPSSALEKIKILVDAGADINKVACSNQSMSALNWAVSLPSQVGDVEKLVNKVVEDKIKTGTEQCNFVGILSKPCKDITPDEKEKIRDAFHSHFITMNKALVPYFIDIIEYLVSNGAKINGDKENGKGTTPLHLAAMNPEEITLEPLNYLIKKGADVNKQDDYGNTPLFMAFGLGNVKAVTLLIEAGANGNIKNKDGALFSEVTAERTHAFVDNAGNKIERNGL